MNAISDNASAPAREIIKSEAEYNALHEVWWAAEGYDFMIEDGHFKLEIALA